MNKWIMLEGVNFDTAEMYSVPREETYGYWKNYWNLVKKNRKKRRGGSRF
jgi:hypothetical protein